MSWKHVYTELRQDIRRGAARPGRPLPTQDALAARFRVKRHAVRRAIDALKKDGLVVSWQGKCAFVQDQASQHRLTDRPRLRVDAAAQGYAVSTERIAGALRRIPAEVAPMLKLPGAAHILSGERVVRLDGAAVQVVRHYFDGRRFPGIIETLERLDSVRAALSAHGVADFRRAGTRIVSRRPTQHETVILEITPTQPVLALVTGSVDATGAPVLATETVSRGDRMHILV
ncbi:MAG: UTRA domain-containing protein [Pseudomonadota bacterium]